MTIGALIELCRGMWRRHGMLLVAAGVVLALLLLIPAVPAHAQIPGLDAAVIAGAINSIGTALSNVVGSGLSALSDILNGIRSVMQALMDFFSTIVYPRALIEQARGLVSSIQGIFTSIRNLIDLPTHSATLANPRALENLILSRNPESIVSVAQAFDRVYQPLPPAAQLAPELRDVLDMCDAQAKAALKRSIAIDRIAGQTMDAADRVSAGLAMAAPGTAPMVEALAAALLVRAHANTQQAMAELMRIRAIAAASESALLKLNATQAERTRQNFADSLRRR